MAKKLRHRITHNRYILYEQNIQEGSLIPGMLLTFNYMKAGIYDHRPLILFFYQKGTIIEGLNLNYLTEARVQLFFRRARDRDMPTWEENLLKLQQPYTRVQLKVPRATASGFDAQYLYETVMRKDKHYSAAYRSYDLGVCSAMKVLNYRIKMLEVERERDKIKTLAERKNIKQEFGKTKESEKTQRERSAQDSEDLGKKRDGGY